MIDAVQKNEQRLLDNIANYAAADKSDPFTFQRCMAHHKRGMDKPLKGGKDGFYEATPHSEERLTQKGESYFVTTYKNVARI